MLFGSASEFLDAVGYFLSVHQLAEMEAKVSTRNQLVPLLKANTGLPAAPLEK
jgi:hypothetical protein